MSEIQRELQQRRDDLDSALGTSQAEGEAPSPAAMVIFERYVAGDLTLGEVPIQIAALRKSRLAQSL